MALRWRRGRRRQQQADEIVGSTSKEKQRQGIECTNANA